ncbi:IS5 family transposase [Mesorhizobium captivum]|uniref:IS5 family transposase n=1 Tax=Mesorhizobium captivum TaxID=3072319 RepID=UPI002A243B3F|nr:IS5 family transposase [Mesorhizobium sp. VK23E]MDX8514648.1 IS5 family transposase [Mesorhizobium sp. VK23E]
MGWTETTRRQYCRAGQRDANAMTDREWALIEPFMPGAKALGRPRTTELRAVVDALLYIAWTGCQWWALPDRFPPVSTVQRYFYAWRDSGLWKTINFHLVAAARLALGREASPSAGIIEQSISKDHGRCRFAWLRCRQEINGRKRHIITGTEGHLVGLRVHAADIQDRDGAVGVTASIRQLYPWLRHLFADGGYAGEKLTQALADLGTWTIEIIKRSDTAKGFEVLPRRWVVERTFAWLGRCRRLAKDFEATIASAEAWIFIASIRLMLRRRATPPRR